MEYKEEDTQKIIVRVPSEEIVFVDQIFKSYEGLAMLTVDHQEKGKIILDVTEGTKKDVLRILEDLDSKFPVEIIKK